MPAASHHRATTGGDDVVDAGAARQIADRFGEALQERPDRLRAAQPLRQLVADVAGIEIREDQHIGVAGDVAGVFHFLLRHRGNERGIGLEFAVDGQLRLARPRNRQRLAHLVDAGMLRAAFGRERQHGHARCFAQQRLRAARRGDGDVGELLRVRIGIDRAIGKDESARPLADEIRHDHEEIARRQRDAVAKAHGHQPGLDHALGRVGAAGHHRVGVALAHHHAAEIQRFGRQPRRHGRRQGGTHPRQRRAIGLKPRIAARVDQFNAGQRLSGGSRGDCRRIAEQNRPRQFLGFEADRGGDDARILALRQNDFAIAPACDIKQAVEQSHASHRVRTGCISSTSKGDQ